MFWGEPRTDVSECSEYGYLVKCWLARGLHLRLKVDLRENFRLLQYEREIILDKDFVEVLVVFT